MTRRHPRQRLEDLLDAIAAIERYTAGKTLDHYLTEQMLRDAVERNIERLSEASRHIGDELKGVHPGVPWRAIADIGNVLRHGYDKVNDRRVWQVVTEDLASLRAAVEAMIREIDSAENG
jgi:uncharacterized protein with HEPN domain